ncbi:MAG TPA: MlaD family protein [Nocardia sp.]|uniref:MlaD family protein n=1 Tax=Nocardia TaxID=1817 RepID=UPI0024552559|nr:MULTISPECIES: MlaD family protein [Nocardia]HLS76730.1 MlaD family protein [Nocardia sp.]
MLARVLGSRGFMSTAMLLTVALVAAAAYGLARPEPETRAYCADMPDSVGLYEGSAVTVLGVRVGEVTGIESIGASARVRFTVRADRTLPTDVGAVTVSDTLLADRRLELVGAEPDGPGWEPAHCITRTLTPQSLSQTFDALAGLADQLNRDGRPDAADAVGGLAALDRATAGTGEQINAVIQELARALAAPHAAIDRIGALIDALAALTHRARASWGTAESVVSGLPQTFHDIVTIAFPPIIQLVDDLASVLPQLNDVIRMIAPAIRTRSGTAELPGLLAAGIGSAAELIEMTPALAAGFTGARDPLTGVTTIRYAPPALALPEAEAARVCAAVQLVTGHPCPVSDEGVVRVSLPALLAAAVSAR